MRLLGTSRRSRVLVILATLLIACADDRLVDGRTTAQWIERFYSNNVAEHTEAERAIAAMTPESSAEVRVLLRALPDTNSELRSAIRSALSRLDSTQVSWIRDAATDHDARVRAGAQIALSDSMP